MNKPDEAAVKTAALAVWQAATTLAQMREKLAAADETRNAARAAVERADEAYAKAFTDLRTVCMPPGLARGPAGEWGV